MDDHPYLRRLCDGTVKQLSPFTGTEVWTVPGRANRPLRLPQVEVRPLSSHMHTHTCAFCSGRYLETPPEYARIVRFASVKDDDAASADAGSGNAGAGAGAAGSGNAGAAAAGAGAADGQGAKAGPKAAGANARLGDTTGSGEAGADARLGANTRAGDSWHTFFGLLPEYLDQSVADFRRIPNLFEILPFNYWQANYGFELPERCRDRLENYLADAAGYEHLRAIVSAKLRASGAGDAEIAELNLSDIRRHSAGFFGGSHDVLVARRHWRDDAVDTTGLAGSATLSVAEHRVWTQWAVNAMHAQYLQNKHVKYVAVFQNWLRPAGASFDHLHKQVVGVDSLGASLQAEIARVNANSNIYRDFVDWAYRAGLVVAANDGAVALAGVGHRYPSLEVYSTGPVSEPWLMEPEQVDAVSDLVHALHQATGTQVPLNEEWHYRAPGVAKEMPWRVVLKWRVSTLAGFEGATKIYLNTIDPRSLRERVVRELQQLRASQTGALAPGIRIGDECEQPYLQYGRP